ncbi:MAG: hypothetical protein B6U78_01675 [Candidatus Aenigmarchaeota archaeon ex4484_224]|nr:MAG: hypothetical protein B6U78_01675 [Candidatus Aenigmarchaeota archaeon ex4484_224]
MKGISPLISIVLIIAIAVAVAGIVSTWIIGYTKSTTSKISQQSGKQINCLYADLSFGTVTHCTYNSQDYLYGTIRNSGNVDLSNISIQIIYSDYSLQTINLCQVGNKIVECSSSNLTIPQGNQIAFNVSTTSSNYDKVLVISKDCPDKGDSLEASYIEEC